MDYDDDQTSNSSLTGILTVANRMGENELGVILALPSGALITSTPVLESSACVSITTTCPARPCGSVLRISVSNFCFGPGRSTGIL